jgi:leucyl-tRNA synthetase
MDAWLAAAFDGAMASARDAYDAHDLRSAAGTLAYEVPELLRWYARRGGQGKALLARVVKDWARALCPIIPHVAEEMWERAGGKGLCSLAPFPTPQPADAAAVAAEEYVKAVVEDIAIVRKLAGIQEASTLALYTTPGWRRDMAAKALRMAQQAGGRFPVGDFMKDVMADPQMRSRGKEVQAYAGKLPGFVTQASGAQKALLLSGVDEAEVLRRAAPFIAHEAGLARVEVYAADDPAAPPHPKQGVASPLKPGIALA